MNKNTKITLIVIGVSIFFCIGCGIVAFFGVSKLGESVGDSITDDPVEAAAVSTSMIDYDLPDGYEEDSAMDMFFMKMVTIRADDYNQPFIMITGLAPNVEMSPAQFQQQVQQQNPGANLVLIEEKQVVIRDQDVNVYLYKNESEYGSVQMQLNTSPFEGKNGLVIIMISGAEDGWDQTLADSFIESIR